MRSLADQTADELGALARRIEQLPPLRAGERHETHVLSRSKP